MRLNNKGFSLLEMVVAVAILGLSFGMLYQAAGGSVRSISTSEDYVYAVNIARSLLAENSVIPVGGVNTSGATADGYWWQVRSRPIGSSNVNEALLYNIEVTISWGSRVRPRQYILSSVVPVEHQLP